MRNRRPKEHRLSNEQVSAAWNYIRASYPSPQEIAAKFAVQYSKYEIKPLDPETIFFRMINENENARGGATEFKMTAFWKATGLTKQTFENRVLATKDFFKVTFKKVPAPSRPEIVESCHNDTSQFAKFFGIAAVKDSVHFIVPTWTVEEFQRNTEEYAGRDYLQLPIPDYSKTEAIPLEILTAVAHMSCFITRMVGDSEYPPIVTSGLRPKRKCSILFGLNFADDNVALGICFEPCLFTFYHKRDDFLLRKPGISDDTDYDESFGKIPTVDDQSDVALVIRVVPGGDNPPWFVCTGNFPEGTIAASRYLADRWRMIYDLYANHKKSLSKDSVVVAISAESGNLLHWDIAKELPCVRWGIYREPTRPLSRKGVSDK